MVRTRSAADISPRSSTSLPTITASITSGYLLASAMVISICRRLRSGRLDSHRPCKTFMPVTLGDLRNLVEPVVDRIGTDAIGQLLELGQILVDLPWLDREWRGRADSGRRGTAHRTGSRACRPAQMGLRHFDRRAEPTPDGDDGRRGQREKSRRYRHVYDSARPAPRRSSLIVLGRCCQARPHLPWMFHRARPLPEARCNYSAVSYWRQGGRLL